MRDRDCDGPRGAVGSVRTGRQRISSIPTPERCSVSGTGKETSSARRRCHAISRRLSGQSTTFATHRLTRRSSSSRVRGHSVGGFNRRPTNCTTKQETLGGTISAFTISAGPRRSHSPPLTLIHSWFVIGEGGMILKYS